MVVTAIATALLLSACGTSPYIPTEYPLRSGLISTITVKGQTKITNSQLIGDPVIVFSATGIGKRSSDLRSITEIMVQQANKELDKAAQRTGGGSKIIELKVNSLVSEHASYHFNSTLNFEAKLGNGEVITKTVLHTSGFLLQDLNGCIAESVMTLLNDKNLRAYLSQ